MNFKIILLLVVIASAAVVFSLQLPAKGQQYGSNTTVINSSSGTTIAKFEVNVTTPIGQTAEAKKPGYEAGFPIAGLLAVAFLVLRQRK